MLQRRRARLAGAISAALFLTAAGCAMPGNSPESYTDEEFIETYIQGCTGDIPETDGTTTTLASLGYCECSYDVFRSNVPFDDEDREERTDNDGRAIFADYPESAPTFRELNSELSDDPDPDALTELPAWVREELNDCSEEAGYTGGPPTTAADDSDDGGDDSDEAEDDG